MPIKMLINNNKTPLGFINRIIVDIAMEAMILLAMNFNSKSNLIYWKE